MDKRILKGLVVKSDKTKDEPYRGRASTSAVDRSGEIVLPSAFKNLADWLAKNPIMYYDHSWMLNREVTETSLPIAKAVEATVSEKDFWIAWKFSDLEFAQMVKRLVDEEFLRALSVGFLPLRWDFDPDGHRVYTDAELLEVSIVGIPANSEAAILNSFRKQVDELDAAYKGIARELATRGQGTVNSAGAKAEQSGGLTIFEQQVIASSMGIRR